MKRILPVICIALLIIGCATKSNISAIYRIPALKPQLQPLPAISKSSNCKPIPIEVQLLFERLFTLEPVLAEEVGRLPEFQAEIRGRQILALSRFVDLVKNATNEEEMNLEEFLKVGQPACRRYCSALQAIFWLLEKANAYKPKTNNVALRAYPRMIEKDYYKVGVSPLRYSLEFLLSQAWDYSEHNRWKDYSIVTDRLNAPELINYYQRTRFSYSSRKGFTKSTTGYPRRLFNTNWGNCMDHAAFAVYCFKKGGYKAREYNVGQGHHDYHAACLFEWNGNKYIMDNGNPNKLKRRGIIPFDKYHNAVFVFQ